MSIHTKITVISNPGGAPEDLDEYPTATLFEAFEWIASTLSTREGVILLRMWFGEQWGGQKTLVRTIGSVEDTLRSVRAEFPKAWSAWEARRSTAKSCDNEHVGRSPRNHIRRLSPMSVAAGL